MLFVQMNIGMQKELISKEFSKILKRNLGTQSLSQPDLNGALFMQRSGIKKRGRRAEIVAINKKFDQHHVKFYVFTLS